MEATLAGQRALHPKRTLSPNMKKILLLLSLLGPGLVVMLADTDAGSIITAAQSGAAWGYSLVLPQVLLIPILYFVQEMTVRLGIHTRKGHGELIREHFGTVWAAVSVGTLFLASAGALITEFAGIAGTGSLFGVPPVVTVGAATLLLVGLGLTGSYRRLEVVAISFGLFELAFIPAALLAHPGRSLFTGLTNLPVGHPGFLFMLAANVGAVIMPWMIFYQQRAVVDRGLTTRDLPQARVDTAIGSVVTQLVMIAVVVATAATIGRQHISVSLDSIQQIAAALQPFLGTTGARILFGLGMAGASFVAALVVSVAGAWGVGEAVGIPHSMNLKFKEAPVFYLVYTFAHVAGAVLVLSGISLVRLTLDVEVMNAVLLPVVLGFLLALEAKALSPSCRMCGSYRLTVWSVSGLIMLFGLYTAVKLFI
ncbi:MAG TPA: divalent metal cation transporter [Spirochaetia bacterium]|nr:divalent metal cation transporter [Spirochaetia bacterium]